MKQGIMVFVVVLVIAFLYYEVIGQLPGTSAS
jgi:hypothetical protein